MPQCTPISRERACINALAHLGDEAIPFSPPSVCDSSDSGGNDAEGLFFLFPRLSAALFHGTLVRRQNVELRWMDMERFTADVYHGHTCVGGRAMKRRICITLNRDMTSLDTENREEKALAALIHHMVHAYFLWCCGGEGKCKASGSLHDKYFRALMIRISELFRPFEYDVADLLLASIREANYTGNEDKAELCGWDWRYQRKGGEKHGKRPEAIGDEIRELFNKAAIEIQALKIEDEMKKCMTP
ncbi:hypothetical protein KEM55_001456 [Ascosphaera atra]|nr:hypothetical protein KEM55_001456 [Ascosphaera atra]